MLLPPGWHLPLFLLPLPSLHLLLLKPARLLALPPLLGCLLTSLLSSSRQAWLRQQSRGEWGEGPQLPFPPLLRTEWKAEAAAASPSSGSGALLPSSAWHERWRPRRCFPHPDPTPSSLTGAAILRIRDHGGGIHRWRPDPSSEFATMVAGSTAGGLIHVRGDRIWLATSRFGKRT